MGRVVSVGTAIPPYEIKQWQAEKLAVELFPNLDLDRFLPVFKNGGIQQRFLCKPIDWYRDQHGYAERNEAYLDVACHLGEKAIEECLKHTPFRVEEIDHLIWVSTTGLATPSVDAHLINRMGFSTHIKRTPIWGLGCAGGVVGLSRAYEYVKAYPSHRVLVVAAELCSLTFCAQDRSVRNLVATSLFGDGVGAALVVGENSNPNAANPQLFGSQSQLWSDSLHLMGWDVTDEGLQVVFSQQIPLFVKEQVGPSVSAFLRSMSVAKDQVNQWIAHPGGMKVLQAYQEVLPLTKRQLNHSYAVLQTLGNMSSATIFFVLERVMAERCEQGYGLLSALGPGFSSELLLMKWG